MSVCSRVPARRVGLLRSWGRSVLALLHHRAGPSSAASGRTAETNTVGAVCCGALPVRQVLDGGTVVMLTRHTAHCPTWTTR